MGVDHDDHIADVVLVVGLFGDIVHLSRRDIEWTRAPCRVWFLGSLAKDAAEELRHFVDGLWGAVAAQVCAELIELAEVLLIASLLGLLGPNLDVLENFGSIEPLGHRLDAQRVHARFRGIFGALTKSAIDFKRFGHNQLGRLDLVKPISHERRNDASVKQQRKPPGPGPGAPC